LSVEFFILDIGFGFWENPHCKMLLLCNLICRKVIKFA
jgi:hypothetical protein